MIKFELLCTYLLCKEQGPCCWGTNCTNRRREDNNQKRCERPTAWRHVYDLKLSAASCIVHPNACMHHLPLCCPIQTGTQKCHLGFVKFYSCGVLYTLFWNLHSLHFLPLTPLESNTGLNLFLGPKLLCALFLNLHSLHFLPLSPLQWKFQM